MNDKLEKLKAQIECLCVELEDSGFPPMPDDSDGIDYYADLDLYDDFIFEIAYTFISANFIDVPYQIARKEYVDRANKLLPYDGIEKMILYADKVFELAKLLEDAKRIFSGLESTVSPKGKQ